MAQLRRAALILCAALAAPGSALADPSVELTGFGDFSSARTQLVFDDLGLVAGDEVGAVGAANLSLTIGGAAVYYDDTSARESGIDGMGCVSNFFGLARPFPDVVVGFASPMHRVGFEARVNVADQVTVTLLSAGVQVDQVTLASRGQDQLYFYGLQNNAGFDQVVVDAVASSDQTGAFTLDNLTFEAVAAPPDPPDDPGDPGEDPGDPGEDPGDPGEDPGDPGEPTEPELAMLSCEGFESFPPMHRGRHVWPVRALLASLHDEDGNAVDSLDAAPVLRVLHTPHGGGPAVDVTDRVVWRTPMFGFLERRLQQWFVWLRPWQMQKHGTYMAIMESGDPEAYTVDPTCADWTVNTPPAPPAPTRQQGPHSERECKDRKNHHKHRRS